MGTSMNEIPLYLYPKKDNIIDSDLNDVIVEYRLLMLPFNKL